MSQAPVHHEDFAELAQHDVFGLEVAMDDATGVSEADRVGRAHQNVEVLGERFLRHDLQPGSPLHLLHGIEQVPLRVCTDIVNRHDVRVIEIAGDDHFSQEFGLLLVVRRRRPLDHFEGHAAVDRGLSGIVNDPHAALTQHLDQFVLGIVATEDNVGHVLRFDQRLGLNDQSLLGGLDVSSVLGLQSHIGTSTLLFALATPDGLHRFQQRLGNLVRDKRLVRARIRQ